MGVVTGLLFLPVTGPVRMFRLFLERMRDEAEAVLRDEGRAFAELIDLSMRHNAGQLTDAEYAEQEAELLERLNSIRDYRNELLDAEPEEDAEDWLVDGEWDEWEDGEEGDEADEDSSAYVESDEENDEVDQ